MGSYKRIEGLASSLRPKLGLICRPTLAYLVYRSTLSLGASWRYLVV